MVRPKSPDLIVITPYPDSDIYSHPKSALASFAHNTIMRLRQISPLRSILVLADHHPSYTSSDSIKRIIHPNRFSTYISLLQEIFRYSSTTPILIELEWNLLGANIIINSLFPLFTLILKLTGHPVFIVLHGVPHEVATISAQFGIPSNFITSLLLRPALWLYYFLLLLSSSQLIVLEDHFSHYLNTKYGTSKAIFIPHPVDNNLSPIKKPKARRLLNLPPDKLILMQFGFLSWYKGTDLIADIFSKLLLTHPDLNSLLLLAGGPSLNYHQNKTYQNYLSRLNSTVDRHPGQIILTDFIPAHQLQLYFSAADIIVLPYRLFISSSGPLSLAFSFHKPVILSSNLSQYFSSPDFSQALTKNYLTSTDIIFELTPSGLLSKINWLSNPANLYKLSAFSRTMANYRSWDRLAFLYDQLLFQSHPTSSYQVAGSPISSP